MPKIMQNIVLLVEPPEDKYKISLKSGNMCLNRFCVDEDASFELSEVSSLIKFSGELKFKLKREEKGKEYSF